MSISSSSMHLDQKKETYEVDVDLTPINDSRKKIQTELQTFCSCPYFADNGQCKHVAAAFFYFGFS
ncbi:SWIM zinc finger family protein [Algoriphagus boritolerans]|uniref:SWIM zinc finger family protein n=1 Tax=Algoriphagus boritolerans TaxID=308111 RepID=UPI003A0FD4E1